LTDAEFARTFERGDIPNRDFHHREHLRLAWAYLAECPSLDAAIVRIVTAIRRFAAAAGAAEKYHETLTIFWMKHLELIRARLDAGADFDEVLRANPRLLDKDLPLAFYSRERLFSDEARRTWVEPEP